MRSSLFDQLYNSIDISAGANSEAPQDPESTPAQRTPELQDIAQQRSIKNMTGIKFTHSLIKHLDMLYSKMLAGEISDITENPASEPDEEIIDIAGLPHIKKHSYYNPGNSAVTESM